MKTKTFYHHLISVDRIYTHASLVKLAKNQKEKLVGIIEETIHIKILDTVLEKLPKDKHHHFLEKLTKDPGNKELISFLKKHNREIEEHIKKTYQELEEELLSELSANSK